MKQLIISLMLLLSIAGFTQQMLPYKNSQLPIDERVK